MIIGVVTVILNSTSNISNGVLQAIGKPNIPMINAAIALVIDIVFLASVLFFTDLGIYGVVLAMVVYAVVMCVLNDRALKKYLGYKNPWKYAYIPPLAASVPMGLTAYGVYAGVYHFLPSNILALVPSIGIAIVVYFFCYLLIAKPTAQELQALPAGTRLAALGRKLKIVK